MLGDDPEGEVDGSRGEERHGPLMQRLIAAGRLLQRVDEGLLAVEVQRIEATALYLCGTAEESAS